MRLLTRAPLIAIAVALSGLPVASLTDNGTLVTVDGDWLGTITIGNVAPARGFAQTVAVVGATTQTNTCIGVARVAFRGGSKATISVDPSVSVDTFTRCDVIFRNGDATADLTVVVHVE